MIVVLRHKIASKCSEIADTFAARSEEWDLTARLLESWIQFRLLSDVSLSLLYCNVQVHALRRAY
jgi:hypothetical protein